ncbi:MerR family transcriptional regulator [Spongiactinospora sp. TRM90649]|uniref:MerR family transcriptional regulator n=1 Tax=Spongiactinospora sp. TRM90649 TaxID=3031114 RepID=UPI0023F82A37|nr:MerR family transcriptional regulator [Spongiactinospora sp. TRM90649]MDF5758028.1 MerR family transcriptional regulator [Spongiactinospora sp. TRM90649]
MRIGELAALLGVSTRTVRHYHHQGVLPEPPRRANGYREYGMRDAVALARVRRLVELGLSLDEARDVIADDRGRELPEILAEIDADLARQEEEIRARRARLASLLRRANGEGLSADDAASPELLAVLHGLGPATSRMSAWDRDLLVVVDAIGAHAPPDAHARAMLAGLAADPGARAAGEDFYRRMDDLADAGPGDPRIGPLAAELAAFAARHIPAAPGPATWDAGAIEPFLDELSPAQAQVVRQVVALISAGLRPAPDGTAPNPG